jgi:hypothetical protein
MSGEVRAAVRRKSENVESRDISTLVFTTLRMVDATLAVMNWRQLCDVGK